MKTVLFLGYLLWKQSLTNMWILNRQFSLHQKLNWMLLSLLLDSQHFYWIALQVIQAYCTYSIPSCTHLEISYTSSWFAGNIISSFVCDHDSQLTVWRWAAICDDSLTVIVDHETQCDVINTLFLQSEHNNNRHYDPLVSMIF